MPIDVSKTASGWRSTAKQWLFPFLAVAAFLYLQWPMIKGSYYRATSSPTDQAALEKGGIQWDRSLDQALLESKRTGQPILVDFSASWCPPCQVMKHEVWPDAEVIAAVEKGYLPVLVDIDRPENRAAAEKYGVQSIPTIIVVDSQGTVLDQTGFMTASGTLDFLADNASK